LDAVRIADLDDESIRLLEPNLKKMEELVRTRKVYLHGSAKDVKAEWHEFQLDEKKIRVAIS
jgi:hypothetical protein